MKRVSELVLRLLKGNGTEEVSHGLSIGTELLIKTHSRSSFDLSSGLFKIDV